MGAAEWGRHATLRQSAWFGSIGLMNTGVDFGVFALLVQVCHFPLLVAQTVSYGSGLCNSFVWNRTVTFPRSELSNTAQALRFGGLNFVSYALSIAGLYALKHAAVSIVLSKVAITLLTMVVNFIGSKWFVFVPAAE